MLVLILCVCVYMGVYECWVEGGLLSFFRIDTWLDGGEVRWRWRGGWRRACACVHDGVGV